MSSRAKNGVGSNVVSHQQFATNVRAVVQKASAAPVTVMGENGQPRMIIHSPSNRLSSSED